MKTSERVSDIVMKAIQSKGYETIKDCAKELDIPYENLRKTVAAEHIPRDRTLIEYARKLGIDEQYLILQAHRDRAPDVIKGIFYGYKDMEELKKLCLNDKEKHLLDMLRDFNDKEMKDVESFIKNIRTIKSKKEKVLKEVKPAAKKQKAATSKAKPSGRKTVKAKTAKPAVKKALRRR